MQMPGRFGEHQPLQAWVILPLLLRLLLTLEPKEPRLTQA